VSAAGQRERVPAAPPTPENSGLLIIDKPAGVTSHDVVELVRRRLSAAGAGHLGTLDPAATGLLLVAVRAATRCVGIWQGGEKTYEATLRFGITTTSQDLQGEVLERSEVAVGEPEIRVASVVFTGSIEQVPPMVSALKVGGRRLHELARRGVVVERAPRRVQVAEWTWLDFALPEARFRVRCSGGTYVRTLAHDLGTRLGCGAAIVKLRRLRSEPFDLARAVTVPEIRDLDAAEIWSRAGVPLGRALGHLPHVILEPAEIERIGHGNSAARPAGDASLPVGAAVEATVVLVDGGGVPLALAASGVDGSDPARVLLQPRVVFPWAVA
jgi:tRNA pseudouridine55 synthase